MKNKLILYSNSNDLNKKLNEYAKNFKNNISSGDEAVMLFGERNDMTEKLYDDFAKEFEPEYMIRGLYSVGDVTTNNLLDVMNEWFSNYIAGKEFSKKKNTAHLFLIFDVDNVQAEYLINLQKRANVAYHIFFKKDKYDSGNLAISLHDYIPLLGIEIIS